MCGIAGFIHFDIARTVDPVLITKMTDSISHRGPDGEGYYLNQNLAFGHRRLSIIDLTTGTQPMLNEEKNIVLIFNGEIYNYIELREELKNYGHRFHTSSDTEVIIKSYQQWGIDCQNKFNGMWAFALWDQNNQLLILSRDRIGEKPLHYAVVDNTLVFGSEIKSLFAYGIPKIANYELLEIYLSLSFIPAPLTFFKNIHKLQPGNCIIVSGRELKTHQYWDLPEIDENNMLIKNDKIFDQFESLFTSSVKIRMRSDVPYGAFLSGGLDSSCIVSVMSEISKYPVETFTIGFNDKKYDERSLASEVANKFKTNHHEYIIEPTSFEESLNKIAFSYDEPFGDSSAIPTGYVSRFAASKVKMVLTGDGGDELLSGYTNYQHEKFANYYQYMPGWFQKHFPSIFSSIPRSLNNSSKYKLSRAQIVSKAASMTFENRFLFKDTCIELPIIKQLIGNEKVFPIEEYISDFMSKCSYQDSFYKLMYLHFKLTLPDDMLVKVDRMSMAYSLEARAPFLDFRLIEHMINIHKDIKMHRFERKTILRKTIARNLPSSLLKASKKGFSVPLHEWFKKDSFTQSLNNLKKNMPFLRNQTFDKIIQSNNNGTNNYGNFIWMLFILNKSLS
jgi:asparagine synthase (glutamine-hydrolysing)